jgi:hypothetical protein
MYKKNGIVECSIWAPAKPKYKLIYVVKYGTTPTVA